MSTQTSTNKAIASKDDTVSVHYRGTFTDGEEFDSSKGREPFEFVLGAGKTIPGFDKAVLGMAIGEKKTVTIPAKDAYGEISPDEFIKLPRSMFSSNIPLEVGAYIPFEGAQDKEDLFQIVEITEDFVVFVEPKNIMVGKDLVFEIELISIS